MTNVTNHSLRNSDAEGTVADSRIELEYSREHFDKFRFPNKLAASPNFVTWVPSIASYLGFTAYLRGLDFQTAADPFVGSGSVAYLLKSMGSECLPLTS